MNSKELQKALVIAVTEDYVKETGDQNPDSEKIQKYIEQKGGDKYLEQKLKALTKKAAHGAKLDYISKLKSPCSEGETLEVYKKGGQLCTRCIKGNFGRKLPTAPDASEAYRNGNIKRRKNFTVVTASISSAPDPRRIEQRIKGKDTTYVETPGNIGEGIRIKHRKASSTDKDKSEYNILKRRFKQAAAQATTSFKNGKKIKVSCGGTKVAEKGCKVKKSGLGCKTKLFAEKGTKVCPKCGKKHPMNVVCEIPRKK